jgi:hypothetical protein
MKLAQKVSSMLIASTVLFAPVANAQTVFTNAWNSGAPDAGAWSQPTQMLAGQFKLGATAAVNGASWYGSMFSADPLNTGDTWSFDLMFWQDAAGSPGTLITSRSVVASVFDTGIDVANGVGPTPERAYLFNASFGGVSLSGLTSYFFSAINTQQTQTFRWNTGLDQSYSGYFSIDGGANWTDLTTRAPVNFSLEATTVTPEPSTYLLMGSGLLFVGGIASRRRRSSAS